MAMAMRRSWAARIIRGLGWFAVTLTALVLAAALYIYLPGGKDRLEARFSVPALVPVDFATLRKDGKPHSFLVLPPGLGVEPADLTSPVFEMPADQLSALWREKVAIGANVSERRWDAQTRMTYAVERTPLMRFPDLITAQFIDTGGGRSTLAVYSTAVYGIRDQGVNEARVRAWLKRLTEAAHTG
jgi:Protein of unknown function (DUF1499)